jgi:CubicO group peptidase (beta-lactamase class C family)
VAIETSRNAPRGKKTRWFYRQETLDELTTEAVHPTSGPRDNVLQPETAYSLGFRKPAPTFKYGSSDRCFGIGGIGGSFAFADQDAQIGYAYAMTRPGFRIFDDSRSRALHDALYRCLEEV